MRFAANRNGHLVGLYILNRLGTIIDICGLLRDDELGVIINLSKPDVYEKTVTFKLILDIGF